MKAKLLVATSVLAAGIFSGCAVTPTRAFIYQDTTIPYHATSAQGGSKVGVSDECTNILGIIATGDCSISNAAKKAGITKITSVDWEGTNILGIYRTGKTIVRGE